jgi:hypothetical protein
VHSCAASRLYLPALHDRQEYSADPEAVPAGQLTQAEYPVRLLFPAPHMSQEAEPVEEAKVPFKHGVQMEAMILLSVDLPAAQSVHTEAPA